MIHHFKKIVVAQTAKVDSHETVERWVEPHGCLQSVVDSPEPGFVRHVLLGAEGVQVRHNDQMAVLPLALVLALAEQINPNLKPPAPKQLAEEVAHNQALIEK